MAARSGSLGWTVLAGGISLAIAGAMWGVMDATFVDTLVAMDSWQAPAGSVPAMGRSYVIAAWNWFLLLPLLRVGIEGLVAARLRGATTNIPAATVVLFVGHLFVIILMLVFPELGGAMYDHAANSTAVSDAGFMDGVNLAWNWGIGVLPAVMLLLADVWYLSEPIKNDLLRA